MKRWHLPSVAGSSDKLIERQAGSTAPRTPSVDRQKPRVLSPRPNVGRSFSIFAPEMTWATTMSANVR
jgi:hypothetical protein